MHALHCLHSCGKMLLEWQVACPRLNGKLYRVFGGRGHPQTWPQPPRDAGGPILYANYLRRYGQPAFKAAGVRSVHPPLGPPQLRVNPSGPRVEVGTVAKLAGHTNPAVTLGHYTQAVRGGAGAVALLNQAYGAGS